MLIIPKIVRNKRSNAQNSLDFLKMLPPKMSLSSFNLVFYSSKKAQIIMEWFMIRNVKKFGS